MSETAKPGATAIGFASPIGPLAVFERAGAVVSVSWSAPETEQETPILAAAKAQLDAYFFCGLRRFELPLAPEGSDFERKVWQAMLEIPYGQTRSYGEIAQALGGTAREVGSACARNPIPILIPCHRVMGAGGTLVGYSGGKGIETKQALLVLEGALLL